MKIIWLTIYLTIISGCASQSGKIDVNSDKGQSEYVNRPLNKRETLVSKALAELEPLYTDAATYFRMTGEGYNQFWGKSTSICKLGIRVSIDDNGIQTSSYGAISATFVERDGIKIRLRMVGSYLTPRGPAYSKSVEFHTPSGIKTDIELVKGRISQDDVAGWERCESPVKTPPQRSPSLLADAQVLILRTAQ